MEERASRLQGCHAEKGEKAKVRCDVTASRVTFLDNFTHLKNLFIMDISKHTPKQREDYEESPHQFQ